MSEKGIPDRYLIDENSLFPSEYFSNSELERLYEHERLLERVFSRGGFLDVLRTVSGERSVCLVGSTIVDKEVVEEAEIEPWEVRGGIILENTAWEAVEVLQEFDVDVLARRESQSEEGLSRFRVLVVSDQADMTDAEKRAWKNQNLSDYRIGELLGYPDRAIKAFYDESDVRQIGGEELAENLYEVLDEGEINVSDEIKPVVFLKTYATSGMILDDSKETAKWLIEGYLDRMEFASAMEEVLDSSHVRVWEVVNPKTRHLLGSEDVVAERFLELQRKYGTDASFRTDEYRELLEIVEIEQTE